MRSIFVASAIAIVALWSLTAHAQDRDLLVFGASSLKDALDTANAQYQHDTGHKVAVSYGASSVLAREIENGAPADVFISADIDWMDYVMARKLVKPETRFNLLGNKLVLITPVDSKINLTIGANFPLAQSLGNDRLALADPNLVPAGIYAKAALESLGVWSSVSEKIVSAPDVRAAILLVARGEAPLGIVYETDAVTNQNVRIVGVFPASTHPPIIYPIAVATASTNREAIAYVNHLKSSSAKPAFELQSFIMLR